MQRTNHIDASSNLVTNAKVQNRLESLLERWSSALEQHGIIIGLALLAIFFFASVGTAAWKFLWYDELVTVGTAALPTWRDVVHFFSSGLDTTSATCALIVHFALRLPISPELSARLPFIVAFGCMLGCVVVFVRRRYPLPYALAAATMLVLPPILRDISVEARGYALALAATAIAMLSWQATVDPRPQTATIGRWVRLLGLWFGLALALNVQAFSIFLFPAFALAQIVCDRRRGRIDWPVWMAIAIAPLGIANAVHGELLAKHFYGGHFWAQPHPDLMLESYREMILEAGVTFVAILLAFCLWVGIARVRQNVSKVPESQCGSGFSAPEWTLVAVLAAMPLYALPASYLLHVYRTRYVVPFAVGLFILAAALLAELAWRSRGAGTALLTALLACAATTMLPAFVHGLRVSLHPVRLHADRQQEFEALPWVRMLENSPFPAVAGDNLTYSQLRFYASPALNDRLVILTDVADISKYPDSQTSQMNMVLFGQALHYRTLEVGEYTQQNAHFLLATRPDAGTWIVPFLLQRQREGSASMEYLGPGFDRVPGHDTLFDVHTLPVNKAASAAQAVPRY